MASPPPAAATIPGTAFRPIALSTCWSSHRHPDGYPMLKEIADLGFRRVELGHGTKVVLVEGIRRAVEEGLVEIVSCHNICPLPPGITSSAPNLYVPSSRDERERAQWVRHTLRSIEFAAQVGARYLVVHLGRIDFFWGNPAEALRRRAKGRTAEDLAEDPAYGRARDRAAAKLAERAPAFWANVVECLLAVLPAARERGVVLAGENRERADELPLDDMLAELRTGELAEYRDVLALWHDAGHAFLKQQAGLATHAGILAASRPALAGFHLHDVGADGHDHHAPGRGAIDWSLVRAHLRPEHTLVLEPSPRLTAEDLVGGREFLERLVREGAPPTAGAVPPAG